MTTSLHTKAMVLLLLLTCSLLGCQQPAEHSSKATSLHFSIDGAFDTEPVALLYHKTSYRLIYTAQAHGGSDERDGIYQAVSNNLVDWTDNHELIFRDLAPGMLKGGIVIDSAHTSRAVAPDSSLWVAVLTNTQKNNGNVQPLLAFSADEGGSWKSDTNNLNFPMALIHHPQHLSINWHPGAKKWIMAVAIDDHAELYSSKNLRSWHFESSVGGDFFPEEIKWQRATLFPTDSNGRWVLLADIKGKSRSAGGGTVYFIGNFDGTQFLNTSSQLRWLDYGENVYGSVVCIGRNNARVNIAWKDADSALQGGRDEHSSFVSVPRELKLDTASGGDYILSSPVQELNAIASEEKTLSPVHVSYKSDNVELVSRMRPPFEVILTFNTSNIQKGSFPRRFGISFWNDGEQKQECAFVFDRFGYYYFEKPALMNTPVKMPVDHLDSTMNFRVIVGASTIEVFAEGNRLVMTDTYSDKHPINTLKLFSEKGDIDLLHGRLKVFRP